MQGLAKNNLQVIGATREFFEACAAKGGESVPNYPRKAKANQRLAAVQDESPALTPKQEKFALAICEGKTAKEAYRIAYATENMKETSISVESSRLARHPEIALFIRLIQRKGLENQGITRESHLSELARLRELAVENQQVSAGVQAEHYRGRVAGFYSDRLDLRVGPSDESIVAALAALLGPEATLALSHSLGIESGPLGLPLASQGQVKLALPSPLDVESAPVHGQGITSDSNEHDEH